MEYVIGSVVFIFVVFMCVVGIRTYLKNEKKIMEKFAPTIIPDTGNLEKVMNRISNATSWGYTQFKFATEYKFGDIVLTYTHGGECSRFSGVSFKGVKVPLGTKETEQLDDFACKIIAKNKEQERLEEEQVLASL